MSKYSPRLAVKSAAVWTRDKLSGPNIVGHWGVVVSTSAGDFLIHNTPATGTVATPASSMSASWKRVGDVSVKGVKTIRGCMRSSGGAHTKYVSKALARYLMGATCVGTSADIVQYLES